MSYIRLDSFDLLLAAVLVGTNAGISIWLRLAMERQLLIAALRMVVQLTLMGFFLKTLFEISSLPFTLAAMLAMILFAGNEVRLRQKRRFEGFWSYAVGAVSLFFSVALVTAYSLGTQIQADPWYAPRYAIPLFVMILGNTMTGTSLGLNTITETLARERAAVEARLALGHPYFTAVREPLRDAARTGFIPIVNSMAAVGLVFLPGMMTGQILSGVDPIEAIKYQMLVMFLISGGTGMGVILAIHIGAWRLTDRRDRLRLDRLAGPGEPGNG
ncbi:MAG: iron export ABC transporter permease subunit FetB [bacterium]